MWSSRPLTDCWLNDSGVWIDIPDTGVELALDNEATLLFSYSIVVTAAKIQTPGSPFLVDQRNNGATRDFLQVTVSPQRTLADHVRTK